MAKATNATEFIAEIEEFAKDNQAPEGHSWLSIIQRIRHEWDRNPEGFWKHREQTRQLVGIYKSFQFHTEDYVGIMREIRADFPHWYIHPSTNPNQPAMIAYTKTEEGGRKDVQVATKMGKFLTGFNRYAEQTINNMANEYKVLREQHANDTYGLHFTDDPSQMIDVYRLCTTGSCMSYDVSRWKLKLMKNEHLTEEQLALLRGSLQRDMLHPVAVYGLIDHIKLAYLVQPEGIVARAFVNTHLKTYIRAYGNEQLKKLLIKEGYRNGHIAPLDMPYVEVDSPNGRGIVAPYFDQYKEVPVKASVHVPTKTCRIDVDGQLMLNHYSTALLPVERKRTCTACGTLYSTRLKEHYNELTHAHDYYCTPCSRLVVESLFEKKRIGLIYRDNHWQITVGDPDQFIDYPFMADTKSSDLQGIVKSDYPMHRLVTDLPVSGSFLTIYLSSLAETHQSDNELADRILSSIHVDSDTEFVTDAITGERRLMNDTAEVKLPDGTTGWTARRRLRLKTGSGVPTAYSLDLYERGQYPNLDNLERLDHRIYRSVGLRDHLYIRREDCVRAIISRSKETVWAPPSACVYAVATDQWFVSRATRGRFVTKRLDSEDISKLNLTSKDIRLRASRLVKAYIPYELTEVSFQNLDDYFDNWRQWVEEVHLTAPIFPHMAGVVEKLNEAGIHTNA